MEQVGHVDNSRVEDGFKGNTTGKNNSNLGDAKGLGTQQVTSRNWEYVWLYWEHKTWWESEWSGHRDTLMVKSSKHQMLKSNIHV